MARATGLFRPPRACLRVDRRDEQVSGGENYLENGEVRICTRLACVTDEAWPVKVRVAATSEIRPARGRERPSHPGKPHSDRRYATGHRPGERGREGAGGGAGRAGGDCDIQPIIR